MRLTDEQLDAKAREMEVGSAPIRARNAGMQAFNAWFDARERLEAAKSAYVNSYRTERRARAKCTDFIISASPATCLTRRERQVLELIRDEQTNPEIAKTLRISASAVKKHVSQLLRKSDSRRRYDLMGIPPDPTSPDQQELEAVS